MRQEALHESKRGIYVILNMTIEELIKMMDFLLQCVTVAGGTELKPFNSVLALVRSLSRFDGAINLNTLCSYFLFETHYDPLLDELDCIKKSELMPATEPTDISTRGFSGEML